MVTYLVGDILCDKFVKGDNKFKICTSSVK